MSGEISRDFARSLSVLHQEVLTLKQQVKTQAAEIEDLRKELTKTDDKAVKQQRSKLRRAVLGGDSAELDRVAATASTLLDEELVKQAIDRQSTMQSLSFDLDQDLIQNMIEDRQNNSVPAVTITVEDKRRPQFQESKELMDLENSIVQQQITQSKAAYAAKKQEQQRIDSNALKQLGVNWMTELD